MTEIAGQTMQLFGKEGGIIGLIILLFVVAFALYVHTNRKYHAAREKREAEERKELAVFQKELAQLHAAERKEWRLSLEKLIEAIDRNTNAFYELVRALNIRPCIRSQMLKNNDTDVIKPATRIMDRREP